MDFASFIIASVACITVICYPAATSIKQTPLANKWLPSICGALGGLLGLAAMYINVPDFPAADPLTALAVWYWFRPGCHRRGSGYQAGKQRQLISKLPAS